MTFENLPPELRVKIWQTCLEHRLVVFKLTLRDGTWIIHAPNPPPLLLQINRESRGEVLRAYSRVKIRKQLDQNVVVNGNAVVEDHDGTAVYTEAYFNPILDTLSIEDDATSSRRSIADSRFLIPLLKQARVRHVRLPPQFWRSYGLGSRVKTILATKTVETLSLYHFYSRVASPMFRMVRTRDVPRTAVASLSTLEPLGNASHIGDSSQKYKKLPESWTFQPVRDILRRDGAVLFNHRSKSISNDLAIFLVVDECTFPDEFIWALAARAVLLWRQESGVPVLPPVSFGIDEWKQKIFRHLDGVCVPSFRLGHQPPFEAPEWDQEWQTDVAVGTIARIAQSDLRISSFSGQGDGNDLSQERYRATWIAALLWGEGIRNREEAQRNEQIEVREALGDQIGEAEREEIEGLLGKFLSHSKC